MSKTIPNILIKYNLILECKKCGTQLKVLEEDPLFKGATVLKVGSCINCINMAKNEGREEAGAFYVNNKAQLKEKGAYK